MHAERQHRGRKQHCHVDADRVHPALGERGVALALAGRRLFEVAQAVARDPAAHVLVADHGVHDARVLGVGLVAGERELLEHGIVEIFQDLRHRLVLVVVRVDVDDREVLVAAIAGLL